MVHDWGGPIGLRFAVEHPERVERLVILNTGIGGGRPPSEMWLRFRAVVRELGGALDIGRLVEAGTAQGLDDEVREAYDAAFPTAESKAGVLAFPELVPTEPDHPNTAPMNQRPGRAPRLAQADSRHLGAEDSVPPQSTRSRFVELIPGRKAGADRRRRPFPSGGQTDEVAEAIRALYRLLRQRAGMALPTVND